MRVTFGAQLWVIMDRCDSLGALQIVVVNLAYLGQCRRVPSGGHEIRPSYQRINRSRTAAGLHCMMQCLAKLRIDRLERDDRRYGNSHASEHVSRQRDYQFVALARGEWFIKGPNRLVEPFDVLGRRDPASQNSQGGLPAPESAILFEVRVREIKGNSLGRALGLAGKRGRKRHRGSSRGRAEDAAGILAPWKRPQADGRNRLGMQSEIEYLGFPRFASQENRSIRKGAP